MLESWFQGHFASLLFLILLSLEPCWPFIFHSRKEVAALLRVGYTYIMENAWFSGAEYRSTHLREILSFCMHILRPFMYSEHFDVPNRCNLEQVPAYMELTLNWYRTKMVSPIKVIKGKLTLDSYVKDKQKKWKYYMKEKWTQKFGDSQFFLPVHKRVYLTRWLLNR